MRLYSRWGTNDPREPHIVEYGTDRTTEKHPKGPSAQSRDTFPDDVFMWCGSTPQLDEDGETTDRLEMWRAYGDNGHGVALTTWWNSQELEFEGLEIVEVKYLKDLSNVHADSDRRTGVAENEGIKIVLNGTVETVQKRELTFEELTALAFPDVQRTEYHRLGGRLPRSVKSAGGRT